MNLMFIVDIDMDLERVAFFLKTKYNISYGGDFMKEKKQGFVYRNKMFVLIMSILIISIISLVVYIMIGKVKDNQLNSVEIPEQDEPSHNEQISSDTRIQDFNGSYNRNTDQITFNWKLNIGEKGIDKVELKYNGNKLMDVSSYRQCYISREGYNIPTGDNEFILVVHQKDGKVIEEKTNVFIKYVVSLNQVVKQDGQKTKVTLEYQYNKKHPVKPPRLIVLDDAIQYESMKYIGTDYKEVNDVVNEKTEYEFVWGEQPVEYKQVYVRWSFDEINDSVDFIMDKGSLKKKDTINKEDE